MSIAINSTPFDYQDMCNNKSKGQCSQAETVLQMFALAELSHTTRQPTNYQAYIYFAFNTGPKASIPKHNARSAIHFLVIFFFFFFNHGGCPSPLIHFLVIFDSMKICIGYFVGVHYSNSGEQTYPHDTWYT